MRIAGPFSFDWKAVDFMLSDQVFLFFIPHLQRSNWIFTLVSVDPVYGRCKCCCLGLLNRQVDLSYLPQKEEQSRVQLAKFLYKLFSVVIF